MNAAAIAIASLLDDLQRATDGEMQALDKISLLLNHEEMRGDDYRSGVDMGAFSTYSLMLLERQVQDCLRLFENLLDGIIEKNDLRRCQEPLFTMNAQSSFEEQIRLGAQTLTNRQESLENIKKEVLDADPEAISRALPEEMREQIQLDIEAEINKLGQS